MPLIIVKRRFYDAFCEGTGRLARVDAFEVRPAGDCPELSGVYPDLHPSHEIALITLALLPE
jgi:hypothetical protein